MTNPVDERPTSASRADWNTMLKVRVEGREAAFEALRKELDKGLTPDESCPAEEVFNRLKRKYGNQKQLAFDIAQSRHLEQTINIKRIGVA